jgi:hypothetical protein
MSIRKRLEDAQILLASGRPDGALLSACAAISATSRRRYPDRKAMSDREAFVTFLGEEIPVVTAGGIVEKITVRYPGANKTKYPDEMMPLQDVLYEFVRCTLAHEGRIGRNVEFTETDDMMFSITDDRLVLGGAMVRCLLTVPQFAPENADEFPSIAAMPPEVVAWMLFGQRRASHVQYMEKRLLRQQRVALNVM